MPGEYDNDLLREGIFHYRVKEYDLARNYIERALSTADDLQTQAQANYYLSLLSIDPMQKRQYLEETLAIDITHAEARRALAILDGKLMTSEVVNADSQTAGNPHSFAVEVQAERFTCPKCGGRRVYAPDGISLICEYCNQASRLSTKANADEQDFFIAMANGSSQRAPANVQTFGCQGCGARFILAADQITVTCAYCGSVHVVATNDTMQMIEPDSILPMTFDQKQANWKLVKWVEEMKIMPEEQVQAPRGLYLPVWTFDILGNIPWNGMVYRDKRMASVSGEKSIHFEDVRILGSKRLADTMLKVIPEFDLKNATAYDARFLAGWLAAVYDQPMAEASLDARSLAVERVRAMIRSEFGTVMNLAYSSSMLMISAFKLILAPVWVTAIKILDRTYPVVINGRSGCIYSEMPERGLVKRIWNKPGNR
jgi:hypothetical protein